MYEYDAFGNQKNCVETDPNPFRYCGEPYDSETESYYLRARMYNTVSGRFTSEDSVRGVVYAFPSGQEITDPLSLNLYVYAANNPIRYQDSSGRFFLLVTAAIGAVAGGIIGGVISYAMTGEVSWQTVAASAIGGALVGATMGTVASVMATAGSIGGTTAFASTSTVIGSISGGTAVATATAASTGTIAAQQIAQKPSQIHHVFSHINQTFTPQFQNIVSKYGLKLNDTWNKIVVPHLGRHTNAYHEYMLRELSRIDQAAKGNVNTFLKLFEEVKQAIINNPDILYKK